MIFRKHEEDTGQVTGSVVEVAVGGVGQRVECSVERVGSSSDFGDSLVEVFESGEGSFDMGVGLVEELAG